MQVARTSTPIAAPTPIAPGTPLGRIVGASSAASVPVTAGATILSGVVDVREAAATLINEHWTHGAPARVSGLVAFVRNGDAYDAVQLLAPSAAGGPAPAPIWMIGDEDLRFDPAFDVSAVWQVSAYGGPVRSDR
jgi:hypothetical protein